MKNVKTVILLLVFSIISTFCFAQKKIVATYSGGDHHEHQILTIYSDSTFEWRTEAYILFGVKTKRIGFCIFIDTEVFFAKKKKLAFLIPFKKRKYKILKYRILNNKILLYPKSGENDYYNQQYNYLLKREN